MSTNIKNTVIFTSAVLTNPTLGTVLYEAGVTGATGGKGLADIQVMASAAISLTYTTIYDNTVTAQVLNMTSSTFGFGTTAIAKIEMGANLTGTIEINANELLS